MARVAARGARLSRLHPSEDHSGGEPGAHRDGRALCGSRSASTSSCPDAMRLTALAPEKTRRLDQARDGRDSSEAAKSTARGWSRRRAAFLARRAKHADHRGRGSQHRRVHSRDGGFAVPLISAEARVLLGVQPDSALLGAAAESRATADARAPAVSGGLAAALLRVLDVRDLRRVAFRSARSFALDPKTTWALANRELFPVDVNVGRQARGCCACRGWGRESLRGFSPRGRHRRLRFADLKAMGASLERARFFHGRRGLPPERRTSAAASGFVSSSLRPNRQQALL